MVATVLEIGYYKASSNEIARRAGVTWGAIQRLFGSRERLMLSVVEDEWAKLERQLANAQIVGSTLEARLHGLLDVLATYYEQPAYLVQIQILMDAAVNPAMTARTRRVVRGRNVQELAVAWQPLFTQALGEAARHEDLVVHAFTALRGYLAFGVIVGHITGPSDDTVHRDLMVRGVAAAIRDEAARRGVLLD